MNSFQKIFLVFLVQVLDTTRNANCASITLKDVFVNSIRNLLIPSQFPNVAPYIRFPSENESARSLPESIHNRLTWRKGQRGLLSEIVQKAGFRKVNSQDDPLGSWTTPIRLNKSGEVLSSLNNGFRLRAYQKFRHFPGAGYLFTKAKLAKLVNLAGKKFGQNEFNFTPLSFILPKQKVAFEKEWEEHEDKIWIDKAPALSRGNGLHLIKHPSEVTKGQIRVVQKYVSDSFTLQGNKSHLIMYAVVTSVHPLRLYMRDDLALTVGLSKYTKDLSSLDNTCIHIPNYATFMPLECNQGYFLPDRTDEERAALHVEFYEMLERNNSTKEEFLEKVQSALIKSILASKYFSPTSHNQIPVYHTSKYNAFHWMSIDYAIDNKGNPYLLEVNHTPTLRTGPIGRRDHGLYRRKSQAISGALTLAGFQLPPTLPRKARLLVASVMNQTGKDLTFNPAMFPYKLTQQAKEKHAYFEALVNSRDKYLTSILNDLTPDDVRHLILAEDELNRSRFYNRVYPSPGMSKYFRYIVNPYYDMLYDAYEEKYGQDREAGRQMLAAFTGQMYHLRP